MPVEQLFDLSLDIDAHTGSMAASDERAIGGVTSGEIGLGETVTWRARHFGVPITMTSRITAQDRPTSFVDEQVRGPFRRFRHQHLFEATPGGSRMRDVVEFSAPFGPIGRVVERLVLARYLRRLIEQRNAFLADTGRSPKS
ncbi:cyclase [Amnibacterium flavum]|uniref:Cyclase n=2 Tax=Amnibacterium flavum TaxID=2173173 RepID=A0A2V1HZP4_9MICO|nr:cyclase [Amnibacterium flavum]